MLTNTLPTQPFNSILGLCGGTRALYPAAEHRQPNRSPGLSATAVVPSCLSQLWHARIAGDQSIGVCRDRPKRRGVRHSLVGTAQSQWQSRYLPGRHLCAWSYRWDSSLDGQHRHGFTRRNSPGLQRLQRHQPISFPSVFYTARHDGDPPGQMTLGEGSIINGTGSQTGRQPLG